jgi:hypothetical protein
MLLLWASGFFELHKRPEVFTDVIVEKMGFCCRQMAGVLEEHAASTFRVKMPDFTSEDGGRIASHVRIQVEKFPCISIISLPSQKTVVTGYRREIALHNEIKNLPATKPERKSTPNLSLQELGMSRSLPFISVRKKPYV